MIVLLVAGCGAPPWQEAESRSAPRATAATAAARATPSPTPTASSDLAKGSLKRNLKAGSVRAAVTYWSTLPMSGWTPAATKPLNLSLSGTFADGSAQDLFLSSVTMTTDVTGPDGPLAAPDPIHDAATVQPGYLVTAPAAFGKVFTLPALDEQARSATITFTYEFLVQSAPKASTYSKQSVSDTVVVALS